MKRCKIQKEKDKDTRKYFFQDRINISRINIHSNEIK